MNFLTLSNNLALPTLAAWRAKSFWLAILTTLTALANAMGIDLIGVARDMKLGATPDQIIATGERAINAYQQLAPMVLGIWLWFERRAPSFRLVFWGKNTPAKVAKAAVVLMALSLAVGVGAGRAMAEPLVIAGGKAGGGYDKRAQQIAERLTQRGFTATVTPKNGSDEISLAVCGGRAALGIMQVDAIYARAQEGCTMKPVAVYGAEVAVLLFPPRAAKDELSDLSSDDAIMVDTIGSGTDLFWRTIVKIELGGEGSSDAWASARAVNDPLELAQASAEMGDVSAVLMVRKAESPDITRLLELGWTVGELWDKDINDLIFNNTPLYEPKKSDVGIGVSQSHGRGWVYTVRSFVVVSQAVAGGDRNVFAAITRASQ